MEHTTVAVSNITKELLESILKKEAMKKALDEELKAMKNIIKAEMKETGNKQITVDNIKVTYSEYNSLTLDTKKIKEDFPELYTSEYAKITKGERLTIKG